MRPIYLLATVVAATALAVPAAANLSSGAKAPMFIGKGAAAGKPITFTLATQLRKGPVVVYFFPAAFTGGCNAEAHAFAEAMPDFQAAGATVVGLTAGNVDQLEKFSSEYCAGKFPVLAATPEIIASYDVRLMKADGTASSITNRTSYVIAPNGRIIFVHSEMNAAGHVASTLAAVRAWRADHPKRR
jgi:peroxiredoxin